jgi:hypothetical protein
MMFDTKCIRKNVKHNTIVSCRIPFNYTRVAEIIFVKKKSVYFLLMEMKLLDRHIRTFTFFFTKIAEHMKFSGLRDLY